MIEPWHDLLQDIQEGDVIFWPRYSDWQDEWHELVVDVQCEIEVFGIRPLFWFYQFKLFRRFFNTMIDLHYTGLTDDGSLRPGQFRSWDDPMRYRRFEIYRDGVKIGENPYPALDSIPGPTWGPG